MSPFVVHPAHRKVRLLSGLFRSYVARPWTIRQGQCGNSDRGRALDRLGTRCGRSDLDWYAPVGIVVAARSEPVAAMAMAVDVGVAEPAVPAVMVDRAHRERPVPVAAAGTVMIERGLLEPNRELMEHLYPARD
jgi:hypothetical protein